MQKFIQYACILPCCVGSLISAAQAEDAKLADPATKAQATKKVSKIVVVNNPIFDESDPDAFSSTAGRTLYTSTPKNMWYSIN